MNDPLDAPRATPQPGSPPPAVDPELCRRTIALVGLMGVGKTTVGRRLAKVLSLPFRDADVEIEKAAGRSVSDIFADLGEPEFRAGEHRVIARLLNGPPQVLATGGGAFVHEKTRALLREKAITVWLKTDLEILARRVTRKDTRPLLRGKDPLAVLKAQAEVRYPLYAEADLIVDTGDGSHGRAVDAVLSALKQHLRGAA
ncbi:shikimate kinase [Caulobacter sp. 17J80-11]|uniref:shikimate kinase n=1 Tax=Caulobacter sp. 17J80-11 TaxID=2763502 RepID=UPI001653B7A7|nr:shikimate kinase [Caulobacter sp. 17J80-11]MBC6981003.1 shikimate kinase [Caulobacter sp. 17J80-11]